MLGFDAIFNAAGNFIIEAVGEGQPFDEALAQIQTDGHAEADRSHEIDDMDAARKSAALANLAMGSGITPAHIRHNRIRGMTPEQVRAAQAAGRNLCVLCSARRVDDGRAEPSVRLTEIPLDHPLASVAGSSLGAVCIPRGVQITRSCPSGP